MKNSISKLMILSAAFTMLLGSCSGSPVQQGKSTENAVVENIMARRSIRKYKTDAIPKVLLDQIIECAINAPNGMNQQCYEVKVVDDPATAALLAEKLNGLYKAPVYFFIATSDVYEFSPIDVGLLVENICLSATSFGIGSIVLGLPVRSLRQQPELLEKFGFSPGHELAIVVALGYADEEPAQKPRNAEKVKFVKFDN
ncbi:MAG: nitroreductase family protein [Bacteroidales bacterium]|nr:nitroreductase family protein [Bacteroidales bacterium]